MTAWTKCLWLENVPHVSEHAAYTLWVLRSPRRNLLGTPVYGTREAACLILQMKAYIDVEQMGEDAARHSSDCRLSYVGEHRGAQLGKGSGQDACKAICFITQRAWMTRTVGWTVEVTDIPQSRYQLWSIRLGWWKGQSGLKGNRWCAWTWMEPERLESKTQMNFSALSSTSSLKTKKSKVENKIPCHRSVKARLLSPGSSLVDHLVARY